MQLQLQLRQLTYLWCHEAAICCPCWPLPGAVVTAVGIQLLGSHSIQTSSLHTFDPQQHFGRQSVPLFFVNNKEILMAHAMVSSGVATVVILSWTR